MLKDSFIENKVKKTKYNIQQNKKKTWLNRKEKIQKMNGQQVY